MRGANDLARVRKARLDGITIDSWLGEGDRLLKLGGEGTERSLSCRARWPLEKTS